MKSAATRLNTTTEIYLSKTLLSIFVSCFCCLGFQNIFVLTEKCPLWLKKSKCCWHPQKLLRDDRLHTIFRVTHNARELSKLNCLVYYQTLFLSCRSLPENKWEDVLPEGLHSIRSLTCVSTNETSHERPFRFPSRAMTGTTLPTWLLMPGLVSLHDLLYGQRGNNFLTPSWRSTPTRRTPMFATPMQETQQYQRQI